MWGDVSGTISFPFSTTLKIFSVSDHQHVPFSNVYHFATCLWDRLFPFSRQTGKGVLRAEGILLHPPSHHKNPGQAAPARAQEGVR